MRGTLEKPTENSRMPRPISSAVYFGSAPISPQMLTGMPTRLAASTDRPERFIEMVNAAGSPTFYEFDSTELLRLYREMDDRDEEPVVIYHSHTATEAYPSRTDIGLAQEPNAHYVLVSTREHGNNEGPVEFRSYRINDGEVTEEEVTVVPRLPHEAAQTRSTD